MADKLEVIAGPGLVARFADIAVWAGPQATPALQAHLVSEAAKASQGPNGGDQLANSFISVLQRGDPEPQTPFAVVGPGPNGLTLFLHGPVQAWDSGRWLAPQPVPGWMVTSIGRPWPLIILAYGAQPPPPSPQGNPFDLARGAVPGAGFVLLRPADAVPPPQSSAPVPGGASPGPVFGSGAGANYTGGPQSGANPLSGGPPTGFRPGPEPGPGSALGTAQGTPTFSPTPVPAPPASAAPQAQGSFLDLRSVTVPYRPSLPSAAEWQGPSEFNRPNVLGVNCQQGHFNHPRATSCARCGRPIPPGTPQLSGRRPPIGVLLADDGSLWSLGQGCLIGSEPANAPEVQAGALQPIALRAGTNHTMAPVHAEIQVRDWDAYLVDRGPEGGTFMQAPSDQSWRQLGRGEQRPLAGGSHISCGGRVLTFLSSWGA